MFKIEAGIGGPVAMRPSSDGPTVVHMEIPFVVNNVPSDYAELRLQLLTELESCFRELLTANDLEVDGPAKETVKDRSKDGFSLKASGRKFLTKVVAEFARIQLFEQEV